MNIKKTGTTDNAFWRCLDTEVGDLLFDYLIGEVTVEDAKKFKKHLGKCTKCKADKIRLDAMIHTVRANPAIFSG